MTPPALPLVELSTVLILVGVVAAGYLTAGVVNDMLRHRREARRDRIETDLATVMFQSEVQAAEAAGRLADMPHGAVFDLVQRLATDLGGDADERLRQLVSTAGLTRDIRRRLNSRSWRRRAQGAALASLLPPGDPGRWLLLSDKRALVRARAAESLEQDDASELAPTLTSMLHDESEAVRFAAQQALLKGDTRVVDAVRAYLGQPHSVGTAYALEIAANFPDPRLTQAIAKHTKATDPRERAIATRGLGPWLFEPEIFRELLNDEAPLVRATAATTVGSRGAEIMAADVGRLLRDPSWEVRRAAGLALTKMGPAGTMTLRVYANDNDAYAADMAQQVLATAEARYRTTSNQHRTRVEAAA